MIKLIRVFVRFQILSGANYASLFTIIVRWCSALKYAINISTMNPVRNDHLSNELKWKLFQVKWPLFLIHRNVFLLLVLAFGEKVFENDHIQRKWDKYPKLYMIFFLAKFNEKLLLRWIEFGIFFRGKNSQGLFKLSLFSIAIFWAQLNLWLGFVLTMRSTDQMTAQYFTFQLNDVAFKSLLY